MLPMLCHLLFHVLWLNDIRKAQVPVMSRTDSSIKRLLHLSLPYVQDDVRISQNVQRFDSTPLAIANKISLRFLGLGGELNSNLASPQKHSELEPDVAWLRDKKNSNVNANRVFATPRTPLKKET